LTGEQEMHEEIPVKIKTVKSWPIIIGRGIIGQIGDFIDLDACSSLVLVTDQVTERLYGEKVTGLLERTGKKVIRFPLATGEASKSFEQVARGYQFLMDNGVDRNALLCVLGGGVVGDVGGYLAATYLRGIDYVQIPTTLLAQVDSGIGGKVGINFGGKKNMVGNFYQPKAIISDIDFLESLPPEEMRNGLAEVIKYGLAMDQNLFGQMERKEKTAFTPAELIRIIERCSSLKARVVMADETERTGERAILNFGHTIGHAVEAVSGLEGHHGAAISIGMVAASIISVRLGMLEGQCLPRIEGMFTKFGLPTHTPEASPQLLAATRFDKKVSRGELKWVLLAEIGRGVVNCKVPEKIVTQALSEVCR
jgi:3-dehydroquinate synthase